LADNATIEISSKLYNRLKDKLEGSSFANVSELAEFILEQFLDVEEVNKEAPLSDQESKELHERLRKLGYD
jgi:peroxiredoxin